MTNPESLQDLQPSSENSISFHKFHYFQRQRMCSCQVENCSSLLGSRNSSMYYRSLPCSVPPVASHLALDKIQSSFFKNLFIYLFLERGEGRERGRETSMCGCLSHTFHWGPGPQPRHVPWLGIEPVTLWFADWHSIHWATPARAKPKVLIVTVPRYLSDLIFFFNLIF